MHAIERFAPDYYSRTALHHPDLCFSGAVSLDPGLVSFDTALHHNKDRDVFVVSGIDGSHEYARQPIVAFRLDYGWRWRFDPPWSEWLVGLGGLTLAVALGPRWPGPRHGRIESGRGRAARVIRWQIGLLLLAAALPWALEGYRAGADLPTPGHELREHKFCRYF